MTDEVETVTPRNAPIGGTFTFDKGGYSSDPIPYDADGSVIQSAIDQLHERYEAGQKKTEIQPEPVQVKQPCILLSRLESKIQRRVNYLIDAGYPADGFAFRVIELHREIIEHAISDLYAKDGWGTHCSVEQIRRGECTGKGELTNSQLLYTLADFYTMEAEEQ